jgi:hypothetical protein
MRESLAVGMMMAGALIAVIATIGANIGCYLVWYQLEASSSLSSEEEWGFGVAGWAPALPGGMLVLAAVGAAYARWLLVRQRSSARDG